MDFLADLLQPYKGLISASAATVTNLHQLSGAAVCNSIRKKKSTKGFSIVHFLGGTVISLLVTRLGLILNDTTTINAHLVGVAMNIGYLSFFFWYTDDENDRKAALKKVGYAGAFVTAIFAYTFIENPEKLPFRYGMILTTMLLYFIGTPMLRLPEIIRKKSTEGMPFPMLLTGSLISFLWLLHGIVTRETFAVALNGLIFSMNAIQLSLFAIYPSTPIKHKKSDSESKSNNNENKKKK